MSGDRADPSADNDDLADIMHPGATVPGPANAGEEEVTPEEAPPTFICGIDGCGENFGKRVGVSFHQRSKHAEVYHAMVETRSSKTNTPYRTEELALAAKAEANVSRRDGSIADINKAILEKLPGRNAESIRYMRTKPEYKTILESYKALWPESQNPNYSGSSGEQLVGATSIARHVNTELPAVLHATAGSSVTTTLSQTVVLTVESASAVPRLAGWSSALDVEIVAYAEARLLNGHLRFNLNCTSIQLSNLRKNIMSYYRSALPLDYSRF